VVLAMTAPVLAWRLSVGAGLEDFSWQAWGHWQEQRWERLQLTIAELKRWVWGEGWAAFGLVIPVAAGLWLGRAWMAAAGALRTRDNRRAGPGGRLGAAWLALAVVLGGLVAVAVMFQFSEVESLSHHLTAVYRLLLPVAAAAFLLAALALAPGRDSRPLRVAEEGLADGADPSCVSRASGPAVPSAVPSVAEIPTAWGLSSPAWRSSRNMIDP
jgi:hypothetical protein